MPSVISVNTEIKDEGKKQRWPGGKGGQEGQAREYGA
jgi:hypothetical protein